MVTYSGSSSPGCPAFSVIGFWVSVEPSITCTHLCQTHLLPVTCPPTCSSSPSSVRFYYALHYPSISCSFSTPAPLSRLT